MAVCSSSASVAGLAIRTGTSGVGSIYFADNSGSADARKAGSIKFDHSTDDMTIQAEDDLRLYADEDVVMRGTTYTFDSEGGAAEFMKIDTNGNVGIGATSISGVLTLQKNQAASSTAGTGTTLTLNGDANAGNPWEIFRDNGVTGDLVFSQDASGTRSEAMRLSLIHI